MIQGHLDGIVVWAQTSQSNGLLEALNGLFLATKPKPEAAETSPLCVSCPIAWESREGA